MASFFLPTHLPRNWQELRFSVQKTKRQPDSLAKGQLKSERLLHRLAKQFL